MPRISALPSLTTVDGGDQIPVVDVSASVTKKATKSDLLKDTASYLTAGSITTGSYADDSVTAEKIDIDSFNWYGYRNGTVNTTAGSGFAFTALNGGLTVVFPAISGKVYELTLTSAYVVPASNTQYDIAAQISGTTVVGATATNGNSNVIGIPMTARRPWTAPSTGNFTLTCGVVAGAAVSIRTDNYMATIRRLT